MKAIALLNEAKKYNANISNEMINEAIEELLELQDKHDFDVRQAYRDGSNDCFRMLKEAGKLK